MSPFDDDTIRSLEGKANLLRRHVIKMTYTAGSGHPGGSLSSTDIVTALFFHVMNHGPDAATSPDRDLFVLSKGHCAPVYYAALAESGYFPIDELITLRKVSCRLQGHPCRTKTPGVEMSTGSLGQGLSIANGMALAGRLDKRSYHVYCLCGDGELQEGQIWEAAMLAAHYKLDNITCIVDRNGLQIDGPTEKVMALEPLADKWLSFGWNVIQIDGNDMREVLKGLERARSHKGGPTVIIAKTIKGKGVSFMENNVGFHGKSSNMEETEKALRELGEMQ
ncbi:MAG TPA: transketolase [Methanomassiliicoccales archaeon]|nr:transketolase [Methanomassiliicoccales archaeon]